MCYGVVATRAGIAYRLSAFEGGGGQELFTLMTGWGWETLEAGVALLLLGALSQ